MNADTTMMRLPILFAVLLGLIAGCARAGELAIGDPWIRAAPPGAEVLAGYAIVHNGGDGVVTITGARSAAFGRIELHEMSMSGGVMRMRPLAALAIAPGDETKLAPGSTHLMLMQPQRALKIGDVVEVELVEASGALHPAQFTVRAAE